MAKQLLLVLAAAALLITAGIASLLVVEARHVKGAAYDCLQATGSLQLGISTFVDARRIADIYGGHPWSGPGREATCTAQDCLFRFVFENSLLNHLQNGRKLSFIVGVHVKDGHVMSRELDYSMMATTRISQFIYVLSDRLTPITSQGYELKRLQVDGHDVPHLIEVNLGPTAPLEVRRHAYSLDLSCLGKVKGCDTGSSIFPKGLL